MNYSENQDLAMRFDTYVKQALRWRASSYGRNARRIESKEISLSDLSAYELQQFYMQAYEEIGEYPFQVFQYCVRIKTYELAIALAALSEERRNIILLYYFVGFNDREISYLLNLNGDSVRKTRGRVIKLLKTYMEEQMK